jgi:hypothetical protein
VNISKATALYTETVPQLHVYIVLYVYNSPKALLLDTGRPKSGELHTGTLKARVLYTGIIPKLQYFVKELLQIYSLNRGRSKATVLYTGKVPEPHVQRSILE